MHMGRFSRLFGFIIERATTFQMDSRRCHAVNKFYYLLVLPIASKITKLKGTLTINVMIKWCSLFPFGISVSFTEKSVKLVSLLFCHFQLDSPAEVLCHVYYQVVVDVLRTNGIKKIYMYGSQMLLLFLNVCHILFRSETECCKDIYCKCIPGSKCSPC